MKEATCSFCERTYRADGPECIVVFVRENGNCICENCRHTAERHMNNAMSDRLSDDAKCILGGWFGMGLTEMRFALRAGRPTVRAQAAIDECVAAGILWREPHGEKGFRLKPLRDCKPFEGWLKKNRTKAAWPLMEDIPMKPAGRRGSAKRAYLESIITQDPK